MQVRISAKALRATAHCMAEKDTRYYLNGTLLDVTGPTEAFLVSTDGHVLFAGRVELEYLEGAQTAPYQLIIPAEVIRKLDKKAQSFVLESLPDGRYMLGGQVFTAIDGKFPDYRRVIPLQGALSGVAAQFNPDLVQRAVKAVKDWHGLKATSSEWGMKHNGDSAVVFGKDASCVAVVMPMNTRTADLDNTYYHGFLSPTQAFQKAA